MSRKVLVVLTDGFPYGIGESFLETEAPYWKLFDRIYAVPIIKEYHGHKRKIPANCKIIKGQRERRSVNYFNLDFLSEFLQCIRKYGIKECINNGIFSDLLKVYSDSATAAKEVKRTLKADGIGNSDKIVFYAYWMMRPATAAVLLKKYYSGKMVTRCHGYDLYTYRAKNQYLPFRKMIFDNADMICPVSDAGKEYLRNTYPGYRMNLNVSRLGVLNDVHLDKEAYEDDRAKKLRIVTISNVIPLKRIDRTIVALSHISDIAIEWVHIGDGYIREELEKRCVKSFDRPNIKWRFIGQISNEEVKKFLANKKPHVLINTSKTEGLPVSMMEAMSAAIPVIGTDVGGVGEIVKDGINGFLITGKYNDDKLVTAIRSIYEMSPEEYWKMKEAAYQTWEKYYDADKNYKEFINLLKEDN